MALLAWWKGDWRARAITTCQVAIIAWGYYCFYGPYRGNPWAQPRWQFLAEDIVLLAICLASTLRAKRYWPLWASSFALLDLVTDVTMLVVPSLTPWAGVAASHVWKYLLSGAVLSGVWPSVRAGWRETK